MSKTDIYRLSGYSSNSIYIKRDDLYPFSFGGNKARKAELFFKVIDAEGYDCVVTYGSSSSNHCRVVSNMAASRKMPCCIISPEESSTPTFNSKMMSLFGAEITVVPVNEVHDTIEETLINLRAQGKKPYFIAGGGHGVLGTQAYVDCYREIKSFEEDSGVYFDYIFLASGTGTTQAGLICGQLLLHDERKIVGISIARRNPYGRKVVTDSVREYLSSKHAVIEDNAIEEATVFDDGYICDGYGKSNPKIESVISNVLINYGISLDATYTGKAYTGMIDYIKQHSISQKNILFIHTGGIPLFFDDMTKSRNSIE